MCRATSGLLQQPNQTQQQVFDVHNHTRTTIISTIILFCIMVSERVKWTIWPRIAFCSYFWKMCRSMLPGFLHLALPPIAHTPFYLMPVIPDSEREIGRFDPLPPSSVYINTGICKSKSICHIFLSYFFTWHTTRSINTTILCTWLNPHLLLHLWSTKLTSHPSHDLTNAQCAQNHFIALSIKLATFARTLVKNHTIVVFQDAKNVSHVPTN